MKIVQDYAQRIAQEKVDEARVSIIFNLMNNGFSLNEIAEIADVSLDFVKQTLSISPDSKNRHISAYSNKSATSINNSGMSNCCVQ